MCVAVGGALCLQLLKLAKHRRDLLVGLCRGNRYRDVEGKEQRKKTSEVRLVHEAY